MNVHELFPSKWLSGHDLHDKRVAVEIEKVTMEEVQTPAGDKSVKAAVWFKGAKKALLLNKTNALSIARLHGPETEQWAGKSVTLYPTIVTAFGAQHNVVRVVNGK